MKTQEEIEFDNLLDEYFEKFGTDYPIDRTSLMTTEEIMRDVRKCIDTGKKKPEPKYRKGLIY